MNSVTGRITRIAAVAALIGAAAGLLVFLERFSFGSRSPVREALLDLGHAPLFGLLAVIVLWLVRLSFGRRIGAPIQYTLAWAAAVGIGALSEYMQIATLRDADPVDWLYDIIGATTFLAFHLTIDPRLSASGGRPRRRYRAAVRVAAAAILVAAAVPLLLALAAQAHRRLSFPKLHAFDSRLERTYLDSSRAEVKFVDPPAGWSGRFSRVAEVTFLPSRYPTLYFNGPFPDWSGYRTLALDVYSPAEAPLYLNISIKDRASAPLDDRYDDRFLIRPGYSRVEIPLADIERAPAARRMDLSSIRVVLVFVVEPQRPVVLYFDDLVLE